MNRENFREKKTCAACTTDAIDPTSGICSTSDNDNTEKNKEGLRKSWAASCHVELIEKLLNFESVYPTEFIKKLFLKEVVQCCLEQDAEQGVPVIYTIASILEWYNKLVEKVNKKGQERGKPLKINYTIESGPVFSKKLQDVLLALNISFSFIRKKGKRCIMGIAFKHVDPYGIKRIEPN